MKNTTPLVPSIKRPSITDAPLTLMLAVAHFDTVGEYAGAKSSRAFNALDAPQGTEEYTRAEAEIGRTQSELADFLNSMLFDAYWEGRRAQAEEEKETPSAQSAPATPTVPAVEAFGSVSRGGLHALLNMTLQNLRQDDLFAAAQEAGAQWTKAVQEGSPDASARQEVYHSARKAVRAAVVQFVQQSYLAGVEEGKKQRRGVQLLHIQRVQPAGACPAGRKESILFSFRPASF